MSYNQYVQPPSIYSDEMKKNIMSKSLKVTGKSVLKDITANSIQVSEPMTFEELVLTSATVSNLKTSSISTDTITFGDIDTTVEMVQFGNTIGEEDGVGQGWSVSMSSDGRTVAVGATEEDEYKGAVRVYNWDGTSWQLKGNKIQEDVENADQGQSVAISVNGDTVVVGALSEDEGIGAVRVYSWDGTSWQLKGDKIQDAGGYSQGYSVSISADEQTIVVSSPIENNGIGSVRVYNWNGTSWQLKGNKIEELDSAEFGNSVSITADGQTIAVGAQYEQNGKGAVYIYSWNGTSWILKGTKIQENIQYIAQGSSVSITPDGNTVAIGAELEDNVGAVRVYNWNGTSWQLKGTKIEGIEELSYFGKSVAISADGNTFVVGAPIEDDIGAVRVYNWNGTSWQLQGTKIQRDGVSSSFGNSVGISSDGKTIVFGSNRENNIGSVFVYSYLLTEIGKDSITTKDIFAKDLVTTGVTSSNLNVTNGTVLGQTTISALTVDGNSNINNLSVGNLTLEKPLSVDTLNSSRLNVSELGTINNTDTQNLYINILKGKDTGFFRDTFETIANGTNNYKSVAMSKDGKTIALGDYNENVVFVYKYDYSNEIWVLDKTNNGPSSSDYGFSLALSADGNILAVGGRSADTGRGKVWIHTRTAGSWNVSSVISDETVEADSSQQGYSVALSYYGDTLVVGGPTYQLDKGAVWVYKRIGSTWLLEQRIVSSVASSLGTSVAINNDGSVFVAGCPTLETDGGVNVYRKDIEGTWQAFYIADSGSPNSNQGVSVAISGNGNTMAYGGDTYNSNRGAVWVYNYVDGAWSFDILLTQEEPLNARQGCSIALSNDGNTLVAGSKGAEPHGLTSVYLRTNNEYIPDPTSLLTVTNVVLESNQGYAVAISGDGNRIAVCDEYLDARIYSATSLHIDSRFLNIQSLSADFVGSGVLYGRKIETSTDTSGTVNLVAGTATVAIDDIDGDSKIFLTIQEPLGIIGSSVYVSSRETDVGFTITSTSTEDTSKVAYLIIR